MGHPPPILACTCAVSGAITQSFADQIAKEPSDLIRRRSSTIHSIRTLRIPKYLATDFCHLE
jgi:hypothetical protein